MKAFLYQKETLIGTVSLRIIDLSMGVIGGVFNPEEAYKPLRDIFQQSKGQYNQDIVRLRLSLQLANGCFVVPVGGFSITDLPELPDDIYITAAGVYKHIIEDYFTDPVKDYFLEEPWYPLTPQEKVLLEDQLARETGELHILNAYSCCAYARAGHNDDVLFAVAQAGYDHGFAVVHLTWKSGRESGSKWPSANFYEDFDEFKYSVMYPDKTEWES